MATAKNKGGRPAYEPTEDQREQVKIMSAAGLIQDDIARVLDIDRKTLRKYFDEELRVGAAKANASVSASLYNAAVRRGSVPAAIWWTKARMGWSDRSTLQHQFDDGGDPDEFKRRWHEEIEGRIARIAERQGEG